MPKIPSAFPKIAIVGCPNVGKSSLFNRITRTKKAIVYMEMGTTRDRASQETSFGSKRFILIDTGGFLSEDKTHIFKMVKEQIKKAIEESDILLFVCDGRAGVTAKDLELTGLLRKANKKIFLVVNKLDNKKLQEEAIPDFYRLGMGKPFPVSALHDLGVSELLEEATEAFPEPGPEGNKEEQIKVAIVGRPNVGKSSFVNRLLQEERVIVDEVPGTTRDTIDTYLKDGDTEFTLVDTAGLRHKKKIKEAVDVYSIMRTKEAVFRSDVSLVLTDGFDGLVSDDLRIIDLVLSSGKCCAVCVNKWDLVEGLTQPKYKERIYERAGFLRKYPVLFTSTKTGYNVYNSLKVIREIIANSSVKTSTHSLNKLLNAIKTKGPFAPNKNELRVTYITQTAVRPPTFLIFVNNPGFVSEDHGNFIENLLRKNFGFFGSPIKLEFRSQKGEKQ